VETWSVAIGAFVVACIAGAFWARRSGRRALLQFRARIDRFKLAGRKAVRQRLIADDEIAKSVRVHAALVGEAEAATWRRVDAYIHEIVPFFNVVAYYRIGYRAAKHVLNLFYKVAVEHEDEGAVRRLPRAGGSELRSRARGPLAPSRAGRARWAAALIAGITVL
jgi:hypothetical protein